MQYVVGTHVVIGSRVFIVIFTRLDPPGGRLRQRKLWTQLNNHK
ncbi:hypothetical protein ADIMK_2454 [Marinobacterium lacunae]|uniref:Uncharacterized protein n=1 Tax=Marinobacterium lacunae TaxID=1232683 RepID=A0A081FY12_9GAMM|nr:hypothetical protein ADIMK_2454 [Marinobacterium lacunae]